ncbi:MAG: transposase [Eubacterium sp.]|nr:transposase [Eubacterium sp.]
MPRKPRVVSSTDIYHCVLRSVNQQIIFEDEEDRCRFLSTLKKCKNHTDLKVLSYCLMDNHIHLILQIKSESIGHVFQRITNSFVPWYNHKYERSGHLFQERFFSEPIESESYLINAFRYILQNPVRAGIISSPQQYFWSSFRAYAGYDDDITDTELVLSMFNSFQELFELISTPLPAAQAAHFHGPVHWTDQQALALVLEITGCSSIAELQSFPKAKRNQVLSKLRKTGISVRQLSRVTGFSKTLIGTK